MRIVPSCHWMGGSQSIIVCVAVQCSVMRRIGEETLKIDMTFATHTHLEEAEEPQGRTRSRLTIHTRRASCACMIGKLRQCNGAETMRDQTKWRILHISPAIWNNAPIILVGCSGNGTVKLARRHVQWISSTSHKERQRSRTPLPSFRSSFPSSIHSPTLSSALIDADVPTICYN